MYVIITTKFQGVENMATFRKKHVPYVLKILTSTDTEKTSERRCFTYKSFNGKRRNFKRIVAYGISV